MSIRQAMLAILEQGPMYGYQLRAEFEQRTGETWPLTIGQVYTTLTRLERDGMVEVVDAHEEATARRPGEEPGQQRSAEVPEVQHARRARREPAPAPASTPGACRPCRS